MTRLETPLFVVGIVMCGIGCGSPGPMGSDAGSIGSDAYAALPDASLPVATTAPVDLHCSIVYPTLREISEVIIDSDGGIVVLGSLEEDADLDPGPGEEPFALRTLGASESFVARFDADCVYQWTRVFDAQTSISHLDVTASGEIVLSGGAARSGASTSIDFDPGPGSDLRTDVQFPFVTRLGRDGRYGGTSGRECLEHSCPSPPSGDAQALAVTPDGTAFVATRSDLARWAPDGANGWPSLAPDAGVPVAGPVSVAPDGSLWVAHTLTGDLDWGAGIDAPAGVCRAGDTTCPEREVVRHVAPDGSYAGALAASQFMWPGAPLFDADGNLYFVGLFQDGAGGSVAPDFDFLAGVDRRTGDLGGDNFEVFTMRVAPDGTLGWVAPIVGSGDSSGATGAIRLSDSALDRDEGVLYAVGTISGSVYELPARTSNSGTWILAQGLDGSVLWASYGDGMAIQHVAARAGRVAIAGVIFGSDVDIDFTPEGEQRVTAADRPQIGLGVYTRETCTDGEIRPGLCPVTCSGGRYGVPECAPDLVERHRFCSGCAGLPADGVPCGMHTDVCGMSFSCGGCSGALICGGTEHACQAAATPTTLASGLDHPEHQMALDATHVYFVVAGDLPEIGSLPGDVTVMRVPRDGSAAPTTLTTSGRNVMLEVSPTYLYLIDPEAGTFSRMPKDGSGPVETITTDLFQPSRPVADGANYVYYTAARASSPIHIFELRQYDPLSGFTGVADTMGDRVTAALVDDAYVWAVSEHFAGMYRWPRGEVSLPVLELVPSPPSSVTSWYAPGLGYFDGTGAWTVEPGERSRRTWTGGVLYDGTLASTGLNHVAGLVGDPTGLFAAVRGDLSVSTDAGAIVRIW
jgi:hypothetical protein